MTQADIIIIRPLGIGPLLDRAVRLYRRNFLAFVGIVAVAQIPASIALIIAGLITQTPDDFIEWANNPAAFIGGTVLTTLVTLILTQIATAAITRAIGNQYLGRETGIVEAYRQLGTAWLSLLGALIIAILLVVALLVYAIAVPCLGWATGLGMVGYFSSVIIPLLAPVIVLEQHSAVSAWRRVWDLVRQRFWWTLLFALVLTLFAQLFVAGPSAVVQIALTFFLTESSPFTAVVVPQLVQLLGNLIYLPLSLTAVTLYYFDLRVRFEGLDMALMVESSAGEEITDVDTLRTGIRSNPTLINTTELTNFFAIQLGIGALYLVLVGVVAILSLTFS